MQISKKIAHRPLILKTWTSLAFCLFASAPAYAWQMSGIDGSLTLAPGVESIQMTDVNGAAIVLVDDGQMRLRLSNKSRSFHIMKDSDSRQEVRVQGGYPGGDLRNFVLSGQQIGQSVTLRGETHDVTRDLGTSTERRSCTFTCIIANPPAVPISTVPGAHPPARPIRNPQTCRGTQLSEVSGYEWSTVFTVAFEDAASAQLLGTFSGVVSRQSGESVHALEDCR